MTQTSDQLVNKAEEDKACLNQTLSYKTNCLRVQREDLAITLTT